MLTILRNKKTFKGLQVAIVGDIFHSRVARSACHLLSKFGVKIILCGPPELVPDVCDDPCARRSRYAPHGRRFARNRRGDAAARAEGTTRRMRIDLPEYIARYQMNMTAG
jgi:ornithine carbamoyltransferase